jgi:succinyl-diaminopimelate desuccinylase
MSDPTATIERETLALAKQLIACRSVTPADGGSLDLIAARLTAAGFACERIDRGGVGNLWARHGSGQPLVCLAGHVDVVPPGLIDRWTSDPFTATVRDGYLYGRGAADMKTAVAAMATAAERVAAVSPRHPGSIALLLTSDEEGDAINGTVAVVDALRSRGETIDACILGEPTSVERFGDTVKNGRRGSLNGVLHVKGVQSHIAYPERGRNPIHAALPALAELVATRWDEGNESFPPTSFQISNVRAGTGAVNVIPGALEVLFNFRFSTESTVEGLKARVKTVLDQRGLEYDLAWSVSASAFTTPAGRLVEVMNGVIAAVTGVTPRLSTGGGTSDGRFIAAVARQIVEFGPLAEGMHGVDERVRVADLGPLSVIYERTISTLLGRPDASGR